MKRKDLELSSLDRLADVLADEPPGSPIAQIVQAEFLRRQTLEIQAQTVAAQSQARSASDQAPFAEVALGFAQQQASSQAEAARAAWEASGAAKDAATHTKRQADYTHEAFLFAAFVQAVAFIYFLFLMGKGHLPGVSN